MNILIMIIYQLLAIIGIFYLFGIVLWFIEKLIIHNLGYKANILYKSTMIIGTSIHELSHALFCIIYKHKIINIKLFDLNANDSTFGYVEHEYNSKNIYETIGNFFIGIAPIVIGTSVINLLLFILLRDSFFDIYDYVESSDLNNIVNILHYKFVTIFTMSNFTKWQFYIFVFISLSISLHLNISNEDLKGSFSGLIFAILLIGIVDTILLLLLFRISNVEGLTNIFKKLLVYEISLFLPVFILVLIVLMMSLLILIVKRLFIRS